MILYERRGVHQVLNIFKLRGSTFPTAFVVSLLPAAGAAVLGHTRIIRQYWDILPLDGTGSSTSVWGSFTLVLGFLLMFRLAQAYHRFWCGTTAAYAMRASWLGSAFAFCAATRHGSREPEAIGIFKHLLVRLFSLLHAMALAELEDHSDGGQLIAMDLNIIDGRGVNVQSWAQLMQSNRKVDLVLQWIQGLCMENLESGVVSAPAPLLLQPWQELSQGMLHFREARKLGDVPLPFPLAQTVDCLLILHWFVTPVVSSEYAPSLGWALAFAFLQVFLMWALNILAIELENPFGHDANDVDSIGLQEDFNKSLLTLLDPDAQDVPRLSKAATLGRELLVGSSRWNFRNLGKLGKDSNVQDDCWVVAPSSNCMMSAEASNDFQHRSYATSPEWRQHEEHLQEKHIEAATPQKQELQKQQQELQLMRKQNQQLEQQAQKQAKQQADQHQQMMQLLLQSSELQKQLLEQQAFLELRQTPRVPHSPQSQPIPLDQPSVPPPIQPPPPLPKPLSTEIHSVLEKQRQPLQSQQTARPVQLPALPGLPPRRESPAVQ